MTSDFSNCTNSHKISIPKGSFLRSMPVSIELSYLHYHDLSLWSLVLIFHAQTNLLVFFHLTSAANNCEDPLFNK